MVIINKNLVIGIFLICTTITTTAQTVDLTSVDVFFKVTSTLKEGKEISEQQWKSFDNSLGYRVFAERNNKTLINIIKSSINIAFGHGSIAEKDSILNITQEEVNSNTSIWIEKLRKRFESIIGLASKFDISFDNRII